MQFRGISKIEYLANGKRSDVFKGLYKNTIVAIKVFKTEDAIYRAKKEASFLKKLNKKNIGPKLLINKDKYIVYKFIDGITFIKWVETASKKNIIG